MTVSLLRLREIRIVSTPTNLSPGSNKRVPSRHSTGHAPPLLSHLEHLPQRKPTHAFANLKKIDNVYNVRNRSWQGIHDSVMTVKNRELFETNFIAEGNHTQVDSSRINIQVNKHCMTELLLLENTKVLCLFDTGSNVNLISESVVKSSTYLSSLPLMDCPEHTIRNTTDHMKTNKFIELCFRVKDDYILHITALVVPDFGSVKF